MVALLITGHLKDWASEIRSECAPDHLNSCLTLTKCILTLPRLSFILQTPQLLYYSPAFEPPRPSIRRRSGRRRRPGRASSSSEDDQRIFGMIYGHHHEYLIE